MSTDDKRFPIMDGPTIPWAMIEPHERQAKHNHGQSLDTLASRGGLASYEALAVLDDRSWRDTLNMGERPSRDELVRRLAAWDADGLRADRDRLAGELREARRTADSYRETADREIDARVREVAAAREVSGTYQRHCATAELERDKLHAILSRERAATAQAVEEARRQGREEADRLREALDPFVANVEPYQQIAGYDGPDDAAVMGQWVCVTCNEEADTAAAIDHADGCDYDRALRALLPVPTKEAANG